MNSALSSSNTCIKCQHGILMSHSDAMDRVNGLKPERKCNQCGKEYPAYPFTWKQKGQYGKRPEFVNLYLESLIREMIPIHGQYTVQKVMGILGLKRSLVYDIYKVVRGEMGAYHVIAKPGPEPVPESVLSWTKTETITQDWGIQKMNGIIPEFEEVVVIQWTGKIVSREVKVKKNA